MRVLVLGGTTEASRLAEALAARSDIGSILSFAGRTEHPVPPPIPFRIGGFGGAEGLADYLTANAITAVVDATHPFAARISANAVAACAEAARPLVAFTRPSWRAASGDRWVTVPDLQAGVRSLRTMVPASVFLTTGGLDVAAFRRAPQHTYLVRTIDRPPQDELPPNATLVLGRGPFPLEHELEAMRAHRITLLVTKNSGGAAGAAKLEAARALALPVLMVERPPIPDRPTLHDLDAVLRWIDDHDARP